MWVGHFGREHGRRGPPASLGSHVSPDEQTMSDDRDKMIETLKEYVVPVLRERGFKGSFPHFPVRRATIGSGTTNAACFPLAIDLSVLRLRSCRILTGKRRIGGDENRMNRRPRINSSAEEWRRAAPVYRFARLPAAAIAHLPLT